MSERNHIEWDANTSFRHRPARTVERVRRNLDRLWVTWMVDQVTRDLRREVGLPSRFVERAINRRAAS